ncbi:MAG: hypothetical protein P8103_15300, partial [Candidatus Thiodiazotropha sp.]
MSEINSSTHNQKLNTKNYRSLPLHPRRFEIGTTKSPHVAGLLFCWLGMEDYSTLRASPLRGR